MPSDESHARARQNFQGLRAEQSEFAVADYAHARVGFDRNTLCYAARGGQRFGEDRALVRQLIGHGQKVRGRQLKEFCERSVARDDAEHRSRRAVSRVARAAQLADTAPGVYLADDPAPFQLRRARRAHSNAYELMSERAPKARVPARY